jgi:hypothetical protein
MDARKTVNGVGNAVPVLDRDADESAAGTG